MSKKEIKLINVKSGVPPNGDKVRVINDQGFIGIAYHDSVKRKWFQSVTDVEISTEKPKWYWLFASYHTYITHWVFEERE